MICPDCCPDCPEETVNFNDHTFGSLTNTGTDPPWSAATGTLVYDGLGEASLLWTMPVTDDGTATTYRVAADVIGDTVSGIHGGAGGVIYRDATNDVTVTFAIVQGRLILRADWPDGIGYDDDDFPEVEADYRLTLQLSTVCEGRTLVRGWTGSAVSPGIILQFVAGFSIEDPTLPATVQLGVWVPTDSDASDADLPFPACCPDDTKCYSGYTATGSVVGPAPFCPTTVCDGHVENLSLTSGERAGLWTGSRPYLTGPIPLTAGASGGDPFEDGELVIACVDGSIQFWILVPDGFGGLLVEDQGVAASVSCDPLSIVLHVDAFIGVCCDGNGIDHFEIAVAGVVTPCAGGADREFDSVTMSACGGAPLVACPPVDLDDDCWECPEAYREYDVIVPDVAAACPGVVGTFRLTPKRWAGHPSISALFWRSELFELQNATGDLGWWSLECRPGEGIALVLRRWEIGTGAECPEISPTLCGIGCIVLFRNDGGTGGGFDCEAASQTFEYFGDVNCCFDDAASLEVTLETIV